MRIYSDPGGVARVEWRRVPLEPDASGRATSPRFAATELFFRDTPADYPRGRHTAPQRQFIVVVSGVGEVELDDGSVHRFAAGDILFAEDTSGRGHVTRNVEGVRGFMHVGVPAEFDITQWPLAAA
jgi:hypothetical protein